jgi:TetR/AcrR family transcriptional regulator, regulator of biofilm formation and stress response
VSDVNRTIKGEARRQALLRGVLRVLERGGPGAVTHRAVAAEADVPLAAATYYFSSIDELLTSAVRQATAAQAARLEPLSHASLAQVADAMIEYTRDDRASAIAQYELLFLAMRRENLRDDAELWYGALERAVADYLHRVQPRRRNDARRIAWAIDGLLLQMLWRGEPSTREDVMAALRSLTGHHRATS